MFDGVAETYDFLNHILTGGLDWVWRRLCAQQCASGSIVVDLCCGTGELGFQIASRIPSDGFVVGVDFSPMMVRKAAAKRPSQRRRMALNHPDRIDFILADAEHLPFRDECIDRIGISFSFRNLVYKNPKAKIALKEVLRTLRPSGWFACVETSQPRWRLVRDVYHLYLRRVVPLVGSLISKKRGAYRYLALSAENFPPALKIAEMFREVGFRSVSFRQLTGGIVAIHRAVK